MGKILGLIGKPERRVHPSANTNWALYGLGAGKTTATGKDIDENIALTSTIVYACIACLSQTVSSLPLVLYERVDENSRKRATDHPLFKILHDSPNPEMVSMVFRETMMMHLTGWGNFYAQIVNNKAGQVSELWPLRPDKMKVERLNGAIIYKYTLPSGDVRILPREEVLHIPGLGFDGIQGYSPIYQNREAIGLTIAGEEFGARFFANDATPGIVLSHPGNLSKPAQDRLREGWEGRNVGLDKKHRLAILEEGMKIDKIGIPPNEAQWIELRKFQLDEIARIYRIPPPLIGNLDRGTFSNVTELNKYFATHTITPWCVRVEKVLGNRLLSISEQDTYFAEHLMDGLLRADIETRYRAYATGRQWGLLSANDVCKMENRDPIGESGDVYLVPVNMAPSEYFLEENYRPPTQGQEPKPEGTPEEPTNARSKGEHRAIQEIPSSVFQNIDVIQKRYEKLFKDEIQRIVNKETIAVGKALERLLKKRDRPEFELWLNDFYSKLPNEITQRFGSALHIYGETIFDQVKMALSPGQLFTETQLNVFLNDYTDEFAKRYVGRSLAQIKDLFANNKPEEWFDVLDNRIKEWNLTRADRVTEEEINRLSNAVTREAYRIHKVKKIAWKRGGSDSCPFCVKLDGQVIGVEESFTDNNHAIGDGNGNWVRFKAPKFHPPIHAGCNCHLVPIM